MNSQLIGVFTAALQGGDAESLQVASAVAGGATSYNYLNHAEAEERLEKHQACQAGDQMACDRRDQLDLLDKQRDEELKFACRGALESTACKSLRADAFTALESYGPYKDNAEWRALHDDLIRNDMEGYTKYSLAREYESVRDILAQTPAGLTNEAALAIVALLGQARGAGAVGGAKGNSTAGDFFAGTKYTDKVLGQIKTGDLHAFPESVKAFQEAGQITKITGGDGVVRDMLKIPGEYRGKQGVFEFIKEPDGSINHRLFKPNPGQ
ncbi:DUF6862 domain-containing protein [Stutzerimonas kirkiae]|uniref:DUF6862 domain-containing protein n=1 Tax=Stutzerimonas kirkiae TaxID=2211392 RepID=UPI001A954A9E|nr:hypothetical protein [Stutzerimonas kirkiae]